MVFMCSVCLWSYELPRNDCLTNAWQCAPKAPIKDKPRRIHKDAMIFARRPKCSFSSTPCEDALIATSETLDTLEKQH